ncbi:MAG: ImmA/IrrE family metallo-endopeptidase [Rhodospirillaceae bacterium]
MNRANNINPAMLVWARETAGLTLEEAADALPFLKDTQTQTAVYKLLALEAGDKAPTRKQLQAFAAAYHRTLTVFYLKAPPKQADRGEDFRQNQDSLTRQESAKLDVLLRDMKARQEMLRDLLEEEEDTEPLDFVGSARVNDPVNHLADVMCHALGFDRAAHRTGKPDDLFRELRRKCEALGVFVVLAGDLGSHHNALSADLFRGFAISDPIAPLIVINSNDAKAARSFTLMHEFAHLWLGKTGVSGVPDAEPPRTPQARIEQFCNAVAGEILLPAECLRDVDPDGVADQTKAERTIERLAKAWLVSEPMVTYRLRETGWLSPRLYSALMRHYAVRWQKQKANEKQAQKDKEGGPGFHTVRRNRLGDSLMAIVHRSVRSNALTYTKAAKVLGVNAGTVEPLLRTFEAARGDFFAGAE